MNKTALSFALAGISALPAISQAREINLSTTLQEYRGNEAYLAIYVTDAQGAYQRTLWVAGKKAKYYRHLRDWAQGGGNRPAEFDGLTGETRADGSTFEQYFGKVLDPRFLLDVGVEAVDLVIPGANLVRMVVEHGAKKIVDSRNPER